MFKTLQKMVKQSWDNFQSWDPSLPFSFLSCPNFLNVFCRVLKMKQFFFLNIPSYPLPFAVQKFLTNQLQPKKIGFWKKKKKVTRFFRDPSLHFSFALFILFYFNNVYPFLYDMHVSINSLTYNKITLPLNYLILLFRFNKGKLLESLNDDVGVSQVLPGVGYCSIWYSLGHSLRRWPQFSFNLGLLYVVIIDVCTR